MVKAGKVYLVGAGPGDPDLITHKGLKLLKICDAVIYDRLVSDRLLDYVKENCEIVYVGKTVGNHSFRQEDINQIIIEKALQYPIVVRLKGGDPFVFGRGGEEILALKDHSIPFEVVPGVTSAIAAASYAGIPITHRGSSQSFHVITGHTAGDDISLIKELETLARVEGTIVVLMGIGNFDKIRNVLLVNGKSPDTPIAVISNGTTIKQQEVKGTLGNIDVKLKESDIQAPAVIIIGKVAELDMKSTISYPLTGLQVGITGTKYLTEKLSTQLEELGASVEIISSLRVEEYDDNRELDKAINSLEQYQWLVFTSANSVRIFFDNLRKASIDYRRLSHIRFAVVGSGTKEVLEQQGFQADLIPEEYTVRKLGSKLCRVVEPNTKLLIPRARQGSEELIDILSKNQIKYDDIKIYDVKSNNFDAGSVKDRLKSIDYLTFVSSSGVHSLFHELKLIPDVLPDDVTLICIGEATQATLQEYGYQHALMAKECSVQGLTECILNDYLNHINVR